MTAVVLRCPHCGTTRSTPGECDACHEADVRYCCNNHKPGLWLDSPTCGKCGARFGERPAAPPPRRPGPTRPAVSSRPRAAPPPRRETVRGPWGDLGRSPPPPPPPPRPPGAPRPGPTRGYDPPPRSDPRSRREPERDPLETLRDILGTASRGRRSPWGIPLPRPRPRPVFPLAGCLFRLLLFILLMMLFGSMGTFMLFGGGW